MLIFLFFKKVEIYIMRIGFSFRQIKNRLADQSYSQNWMKITENFKKIFNQGRDGASGNV